MQHKLCTHSIYLYIMPILANIRQNRFFVKKKLHFNLIGCIFFHIFHAYFGAIRNYRVVILSPTQGNSRKGFGSCRLSCPSAHIQLRRHLPNPFENSPVSKSNDCRMYINEIEGSLFQKILYIAIHLAIPPCWFFMLLSIPTLF